VGQIITSGVWTTSTQPRVENLGRNKIRWGNGRSGYDFEGYPTEAKLDGSEFTIGRFTHHNKVLHGFPADPFKVTLDVDVAFEDGTHPHFTFEFRHTETSGNPNPPDIVELDMFVSPQSVKVGGVPYAVVLSGFREGPGKPVVRRFDSPEGGSNSADVIAKFARVDLPPTLQRTELHSHGTLPDEPDEYVEIQNPTAKTIALAGWVVSGAANGRTFTFPEGAKLEPGEKLRVYTNEIHPESGGYSFGSEEGLWDHDRQDVWLNPPR
jgi:hypothetical protein